MVLLGLAGLKGSGKDTVGDYLAEQHGFTKLSFAAPLKVSAAAALGMLSDGKAHWEILEAFKNDPRARVILEVPRDGTEVCTDRAADISVREYLQYFGTEAHRDVFGKDFWTQQGMAAVERLSDEGIGRIVFTDSRFDNECEAVRNRGGRILLVDRPGVADGDRHASEKLPDIIDGTILNDGDIALLYQRVDAILAWVGEAEGAASGIA